MHWDHADCTCACPQQTSLDGGAELEAGCRGCAPPPPTWPEMTCGLLKQLVFCKKALWVSYAIRGAPPPMKNPGSAPVRWYQMTARLERDPDSIEWLQISCDLDHEFDPKTRFSFSPPWLGEKLKMEFVHMIAYCLALLVTHSKFWWMLFAG